MIFGFKLFYSTWFWKFIVKNKIWIRHLRAQIITLPIPIAWFIFEVNCTFWRLEFWFELFCLIRDLVRFYTFHITIQINYELRNIFKLVSTEWRPLKNFRANQILVSIGKCALTISSFSTKDSYLISSSCSIFWTPSIARSTLTTAACTFSTAAWTNEFAAWTVSSIITLAVSSMNSFPVGCRYCLG